MSRPRHRRYRLTARPVLLAPVVLALLLTGCSSAGTSVDPAAVRLPQVRPQSVAPVPLGTAQQVSVASSFGPGSSDVPVTLTVFTVRDRVAPDSRLRPTAAASHWASADVQVCRNRPVVLGYPAWVLGDDQGRTAQVSKVLHPQFPQPPLADGPHVTGCTRGWVTWVTQDILHPTKVTFEQTRGIPGAWRIAG